MERLAGEFENIDTRCMHQNAEMCLFFDHVLDYNCNDRLLAVKSRYVL